MSGRHCLTDECQFGGAQMSQPVKKLTLRLVQLHRCKTHHESNVGSGIPTTIKRETLQELNEIQRGRVNVWSTQTAHRNTFEMNWA